MAPKKEKKRATDLLVEDKLQAVVLTDSYEDRFKPLTEERPRCLLPLAGSPLIEYTLEFLATADVGEVYLMCCSHSDKVEEYIKKSKWNTVESPFRIRTLALPGSQSVGDVMRDLDTKGLIKRDFLLISGDVVSSLDFQSVLEAHNARKHKDKNAIMTMVLKKGGPLHRTRPRTDPGVFILDDSTGRCLRYEKAKTAGSISLDAEVLEEHETVSFRNDLIDCQIDICAQDVPALFQENFDYDTIREHFVRGILTSDLLGKTIYAHIIEDEYAARVQSLQTYDAVCKDLVGRYAYPIAPDSNLRDNFSYQKGHIYKEDRVVLAQSSLLEGNCVIGSNSQIGEQTRINKSTVGRNCIIGHNVLLENAYVWDNVVIEDNVKIVGSIVADRARVKAGTTISESIVSFGVVVGSKRTLKDVQLSKAVGEEDAEIIGEDGEGLVYYDDSDADDSESTTPRHVDGLIYNMKHLNISDESIVSMEGKVHKKRGHRRVASDASAYSESAEVYGEADDDEGFLTEAVASIERAVLENHDVETAVLELNTLRMTMNADYEEVREATMKALVHDVVRKVNENNMPVKEASKAVFSHWAPMISRQIFELADQVHVLQVLLEQAATRPQGSLIFTWAVDTLYFEELLDEEHINEWATSAESEKTSQLRSTKQAFRQWLQWLNTAASESEEESDDE